MTPIHYDVENSYGLENDWSGSYIPAAQPSQQPSLSVSRSQAALYNKVKPGAVRRKILCAAQVSAIITVHFFSLQCRYFILANDASLFVFAQSFISGIVIITYYVCNIFETQRLNLSDAFFKRFPLCDHV